MKNKNILFISNNKKYRALAKEIGIAMGYNFLIVKNEKILKNRKEIENFNTIIKCNDKYEC